MCLVQNVHFRGLRNKINVEFTGLNDHLFYERNEENGHYGQTLFRDQTQK